MEPLKAESLREDSFIPPPTGIPDSVRPETALSCIVRKGSGTNEEFAAIHEAVMATSPNFYNVARPVALKPTLVVE
jgi:hypothetical protein